MVSGVDVEGVVGALEVRDPSRVVTGRGVSGRGSVVFLFSGQGSQYAGMVCGLYERYPVFRGAVDECVVCLDGLGVDVRGVLFGSEGEGLLGETVWAQPVLFVVEYALVRLWESWGVVPDALVGHSLGEWVAACVAGVFSLVDVLGLVVLRGRLMQECLPGSMLSVMADRVSVEAVLPVGVSLAAHNGPRDCVVSGGREGVEEFAVLAGERGWAVQWLGVSRGFHSVLMEPVVDELVAAVAAVERCVPRVPFVSNVTGRWITDEEACDPGYWGRHVRSCVEFAAGVSGVAGRPGTVFVEVGPGHVLTGLTRRVLAAGGVGAVVQASLPDRRDRGGAAEHLERALHQLWLAGVTPDWGAFYGRERRRRVPLPTYPFHRERYWLDPQPPHGGTVDSAPGPHPLLDRQLVRSMGQCVFLTEFSLDRHWVLAEHRLLGEAIVPGTTYLEMGRAAVGILLERSVTELRDVTFLVPLLVRADSPRTVHTTVKDLGRGRAEFTVASQDPLDGSWTLHVQGAASVVPLSEPVPRQDVAALLAGCALGTVDAAANQDEHKAMEFGPRWQESLRTIHVGVRSALGVLDLPERYASECHDFALHPALLDLATGFGAFAVLESAEHLRRTLGDRGFFLPVGYDSLRIHAPLPARGLSCIKPLADADGDAEVRGADVLICDESGATAVEISGFTVKRVTDARRTVDRLRPHARHHAIRWVPSPADGAPSARHRRMLVVTEANGAGKELAAALRSRGMSVVEVTLSDAWAVRGADRYRTAPTPEGFDRLIDALGDELPEEVVHVAGPTDARADSDPAEVERQLAQGVQGLFHLVRCLSVRGVVPGRFSVVARSVARVTGRESTTTAVHATLFGLAKVVGLENEDTDVLCIDMGEDTSPDRVCDELLGTRSPSAVALREGGRYVPELAPLHLTEHTRLSPAQPGEVYLVTGGLGGLGLAVARHLARTNPGVRLALVGRTGLPPREQWDKVPVADSGLRRQIAIMRELEGSGAEVRDYRGDVTDLAEMTEVVRRVRGELGPIGCVIHAAGVAGDGFLFLKDADAFRRTLAPKVLGSSVLDAVTRDDPPRLMVNFGSTVSVFGAAGQSDYTAANSYLVHFAEERTARGRETVTIEWSDWLDVGMAFDHGVRRDTGFFRSLAVEDALSSFDEVLLASCTSVIVGEVNYPRLGRGEAGGLVEMVRRGPVVLAEPIRRAMTAVTSAARAADTARAADRGDGLRLFGREDGDYSDTERALARIWADELGLTELNVRDSCFALGVDSLNALRLAQRIQKLTRFRVSMVDLYRHVTVAELAEHLDGDHS
ncbi:SDR family NAD(P)-dependent oxidoreductase [Streptomyces sp. NPDC014734]|uniref:SDR family NAD(P)-dependent oxidoreductase n=1 Tax=Streptomyces sp. NPDC014734 TaxID=3364886 RepID=UPI0037030EFB